MVEINKKPAQTAQLVDLPHELTVEILKKAIAGSSPEELGKTLAGTGLASKTLLEAAASAPIVALDTAVDLEDAGAAHVALKHFQTQDRAAREGARKLLLASPRVIGSALRSRDPSSSSAAYSEVWDKRASTPRLASLARLVQKEIAEHFAPATAPAETPSHGELATLAALGPWEALARALATAAPMHPRQADAAMTAAAEAGQLDCLKLLTERFPYAGGLVDTTLATTAAQAGHRDCFAWALKHLNPAASVSRLSPNILAPLCLAGLEAFGPEGLESVLVTFPSDRQKTPVQLAVGFCRVRAELDEALHDLREEAQAGGPNDDEPARASQMAALVARRANLTSSWSHVEAASLALLDDQAVLDAGKMTLCAVEHIDSMAEMVPWLAALDGKAVAELIRTAVGSAHTNAQVEGLLTPLCAALLAGKEPAARIDAVAAAQRGTVNRGNIAAFRVLEAAAPGASAAQAARLRALIEKAGPAETVAERLELFGLAAPA